MRTILVAAPAVKVRRLSVKQCKRAVKARLLVLADERPTLQLRTEVRWLKAGCAVCGRCEMGGRT